MPNVSWVTLYWLLESTSWFSGRAAEKGPRWAALRNEIPATAAFLKSSSLSMRPVPPRVRTADAGAPAAYAAAAPAASVTRTGCEVVVYHDKGLAGQSFRTTEDRPLLNDQWNKQIASIQVVSGTWDFSTDSQYGGDAMRLTPGSYRDLGTSWEGQISSFMCTQ